MKDVIEVREYSPDTDKSYVTSTWLRHYKYSSAFARPIRTHVFFEWHNKIVNAILARPTSVTLIAHPKEDPDTILGYLCFEKKEKPVVHFVFTKEVFRKSGVAKALIEHAALDLNQCIYTHRTDTIHQFISRFPDMTYSPYEI